MINYTEDNYHLRLNKCLVYLYGKHLQCKVLIYSKYNTNHTWIIIKIFRNIFIGKHIFILAWYGLNSSKEIGVSSAHDFFKFNNGPIGQHLEWANTNRSISNFNRSASFSFKLTKNTICVIFVNIFQAREMNILSVRQSSKFAGELRVS